MKRHGTFVSHILLAAALALSADAWGIIITNQSSSASVAVDPVVITNAEGTATKDSQWQHATPTNAISQIIRKMEVSWDEPSFTTNDVWVCDWCGAFSETAWETQGETNLIQGWAFTVGSQTVNLISDYCSGTNADWRVTILPDDEEIGTLYATAPILSEYLDFGDKYTFHRHGSATAATNFYPVVYADEMQDAIDTALTNKADEVKMVVTTNSTPPTLVRDVWVLEDEALVYSCSSWYCFTNDVVIMATWTAPHAPTGESSEAKSLRWSGTSYTLYRIDEKFHSGHATNTTHLVFTNSSGRVYTLERYGSWEIATNYYPVVRTNELHECVDAATNAVLDRLEEEVARLEEVDDAKADRYTYTYTYATNFTAPTAVSYDSRLFLYQTTNDIWYCETLGAIFEFSSFTMYYDDIGDPCPEAKWHGDVLGHDTNLYFTYFDDYFGFQGDFSDLGWGIAVADKSPAPSAQSTVLTVPLWMENPEAYSGSTNLVFRRYGGYEVVVTTNAYPVVYQNALDEALADKADRLHYSATTNHTSATATTNDIWICDWSGAALPYCGSVEHSGATYTAWGDGASDWLGWRQDSYEWYYLPLDLSTEGAGIEDAGVVFRTADETEYVFNRYGPPEITTNEHPVVYSDALLGRTLNYPPTQREAAEAVRAIWLLLGGDADDGE